MSIQDDISVFFRNPAIPPTNLNEFSVLYLLLFLSTESGPL